MRKINKASFNVLLTVGLIIGWQNTNSQVAKESKEAFSPPILSKIALLSIHVSSIAIHDSVFHFLTDKLGLSVKYYPEMMAERRYAAVYAGNLYLEPCGPFTNFTYASKNFKAIFFGLNCDSKLSKSSIAGELTGKNIKIDKSNAIQVNDSSLIKPNIYLNIVSHPVSKRKVEDSLRSVMLDNNKNSLGIERVKEIRVGYKDNDGLEKWKDFIKPSVLSGDRLWNLNEGPSVRFVKSNIREVNAIVFKVKSLKKAKSYLVENEVLGVANGNEIELDKSKTFGLSIFLNEN
jgi:hypothetical protein